MAISSKKITRKASIAPMDMDFDALGSCIGC
jgi:hypothetical protein